MQVAGSYRTIGKIASGIFALLVTGFLSNNAKAEPIAGPDGDWRHKLNASFDAPGPHKPRDDARLYRVDFVCTPKKEAVFPTRKVIDLLVLRTVTTSHLLVISKTYIQPDPANGKLKIPDQPLLLLAPYSMNGSNVVDNRKICPGPLVISGSTPHYLYPVASYSTTNAPGVIIKIGQQIAKLISPLWSILQPAAVPALVQRKVTSIGDTSGPVADILSTFNEDSSYGKGFNLDLGTYVVATNYNQITIKVSNLESVVLAKPTSIQETFRETLKGAPEPISADNVGPTCIGIAAWLKEKGFSEKEDIPYSLTVLSTKLKNKQKMVECLQATESLEAAIGLGPVLWKLIPRALAITEDLVNQPNTFKEAKARIYKFMVALSKITRGDADDQAEGLNELKSLATEKLKLTDSVDDYLGGSAELQPIEFGKRLAGKGYFHFGCMAAITDSNGADITKSVVSFLMIKAPAKANSAPLSDALPVHVLFKGGRVSEILAFQESVWAKADADANSNNCNDFRITPAAPAAPAAPKQSKIEPTKGITVLRGEPSRGG